MKMIPYVIMNAFKHVKIRVLPFCVLKTSILLLFSQFRV